MRSIKTHAFRLKPGDDLKSKIQDYVNAHQIKAGWVSTCVGSLTDYTIRMANQPQATLGKGYFEIVGLTGTLSVSGSHLHIAISDSTGYTIGGHLMDGCKVYTTAEIIISESLDHIFTRENDGTTPYQELQIKNIEN
jgi:predicted DNA-binding protein with PD1-like motif